ncbi:hypothetical protein D920_02614 [Enterococcus faecalis 13-SD-W-01]|jgi:hypothetical protein|nr:hypothetical protein D920_02614 [Enterococcus faecalis 13-SD-W-01]
MKSAKKISPTRHVALLASFCCHANVSVGTKNENIYNESEVVKKAA